MNRGEFGGKRIIKPETVELMTTNHVAAQLLPRPWILNHRGNARHNPGLFGCLATFDQCFFDVVNNFSNFQAHLVSISWEGGKQD
jgi:hypothetical protein